MKEYFEEWEMFIEQIIDNEKELLRLKQTFEDKSQEIIANTDFKELYGANNEKVRKNHVNKKLSELSEKINSLNLEIDYARMRIRFLERLIILKTELIKYEGV